MQGALEKTTQVFGNHEVRISRFRRSDIRSPGLERGKKPLKLDCEKLLVKAWNQFGHNASGQS
jgi:hypothetical protein